MYFPEVDVDVRTTPPREPHVTHIRSSDDISSGYSSTEYVGQNVKVDNVVMREGALIRTASVGGTTRSRTKTVKTTAIVTKRTATPTEVSKARIVKEAFMIVQLIFQGQ